jgi:hypothetical protein
MYVLKEHELRTIMGISVIPKISTKCDLCSSVPSAKNKRYLWENNCVKICCNECSRSVEKKELMCFSCELSPCNSYGLCGDCKKEAKKCGYIYRKCVICDKGFFNRNIEGNTCSRCNLEIHADGRFKHKEWESWISEICDLDIFDSVDYSLETKINKVDFDIEINGNSAVVINYSPVERVLEAEYAGWMAGVNNMVYITTDRSDIEEEIAEAVDMYVREFTPIRIYSQ